jgi:hypothetical protein
VHGLLPSQWKIIRAKKSVQINSVCFAFSYGFEQARVHLPNVKLSILEGFPLVVKHSLVFVCGFNHIYEFLIFASSLNGKVVAPNK